MPLPLCCHRCYLYLFLYSLTLLSVTLSLYSMKFCWFLFINIMCEPFIFHLSVPSSHKLSIFLSFSFSISLSLCLSHSLSPSASLYIFLPSLFSYLSLSIPPFLTLPLHFMKHILISTARSYFLHYHSSFFRLNLPPSILLCLTLSFSSFYLFFLWPITDLQSYLWNLDWRDLGDIPVQSNGVLESPGSYGTGLSC